MGNVYTTGPNEALVISGGCCSNRSIVIGGWGWAWWWISDVQKLSLELITLNPNCQNVETAQGVPVTVTGVAQIKVIADNDLLNNAAEQFIGMSGEEMAHVLRMTMDGHLRSILATMTMETIVNNRDLFAKKVREVSAPDLGRMGIEIVSFTIKDIHDSVDYLNSIGKTQIAIVKKNATIAVAEAERDAGIVEVNCQREVMDRKYQVESNIANAAREMQLKEAEFARQVQGNTAEAELAYQLQSAKENQRIRQEEIQIQVVERRKEIEIQEKEVERKERELQGTVRLPAEAESFRLQAIAEGEKSRIIEEARGHAEETKILGSAEAAALESVGKAEADGMKLRAAAYRNYGQTALCYMILETLPLITAEVAAPLAKTDVITILGTEDTTSEETVRLLGNLPPAAKALTGLDLKDILVRMSNRNTESGTSI